MSKHLTSRSNGNLEMLVFMEGGKPEYPEKNPRSKDENQQQTQPTYDTGTANRTQATLVEGECSHHCVIPAPLINYGASVCYCAYILRISGYSSFLRNLPSYTITCLRGL